MRGLPTSLPWSPDAAWRAEARARLADTGSVVLPDPQADAPPPVGVLLCDNRQAPPAAAALILSAGVDPSLPADIPWPPGPGVLEGALRTAAVALGEQGLLLAPGVAQAALQRLVQLSADSIEVVDRQVRLLYVNQAFEAVTGYGMPEVLGRTTGDLFRAGTHDPSFYRGIMEVLSRGEPWRGQLVARRADGDLSYQESILAPFFGADGATLGYVALKRDLARDALLARATTHLGEHRAAMLQEVADAFLLHDASGRVLDRNQHASRMFHLDDGAGGLLGRVSPADADRLAAAWAALAAGDTIAEDVAVPGVDAEHPRTVSFRSVRVRVAGEDLVLSIARDITERVTLERALTARSAELARALADLERTSAALVEREKQAALGGLVAGLAHELNTPVGTARTATTLALEIVAELDALARTGQPTRRALLDLATRITETAGLADAQLRRAATLVADFKRLSLAETASAPIEVDLEEQVRRIAQGMAPQLRERGIAVQVAGDSPLVVVDTSAVAQVLQQLLSNVAHHAPHALATVRVARHPDGAEVRVDDSGPGIPAAEHSRVLEPFYTTARGRGHVGLGLHIAHSLVTHRLGGALSFGTSPTGGLSVRFTVRSRRGDATPDADGGLAQ